MTAFTGTAKLPAMDIRVTRRAVLRGFAEHGSDVAAGAGDFTVLSQQWILRVFVVVEVGNCPDRSPRLRNVAVLTADFQIAVRAASSLRLLSGNCERSRGGGQRDDRQTDERPQ